MMGALTEPPMFETGVVIDVNGLVVTVVEVAVAILRMEGGCTKLECQGGTRIVDALCSRRREEVDIKGR